MTTTQTAAGTEMTDPTVAAAIARSISHTEIVWLDWSAAAQDALRGECEDSVDASDTVQEFWGADGDGAEWRVHLTGPRLTVTMGPAEDEEECERLGLRRVYTVRAGKRVVWSGEADSAADAISHAR